MFSKLNHIFLFCCLFCISNSVFAQYKGGQASGGGDVKSYIPSSCTPPENTNIYFGGDANGTSWSRLLNLPACGIPENLNIFYGGTGGKATQLLISCPFPENTNIFYGGVSNDVAYANITNCPIPIPINIFWGGYADGTATQYLLQQICGIPENLNLFTGGAADGFANGYLNQLVCPPAENTNIFIGGNFDGYSNSGLLQSVCPSVENYNISFGGDADGYAQITLTQSICALPENVQIFQGGSFNGDAIIMFNQTICPTPENNNIFLGGTSDGFFINFLLQQVCSTPENINIFLGGDSDGYSIVKFQQSACSVAENINVYMGGFSDGYAKRELSQQSCLSPENVSISFGGNGNGDAFLNLVSCIPPVNTNLYFGGVSNDAASANITNCPVPTLVNIYTGGNANGASYSILALACIAAENTNIYFGGDANGASKQEKINSICSPPDNINIYFGGDANGAVNSQKINSICPPPDNLNICFGGDANGAANSQKINTICSPADNLSISFGGDANGAAYSRMLILPACPPPTNENIFFGGVADGYARRSLIQPYYWTGTVDRNWHNPLNWSSEAVPDISSLAIIPSVGIINFPIVSLANAESNSLVIQNGANIQITNKNFTSEFNLVNDGTITITGTPLITIGGDFHGENGTTTTGNAKFLFNASAGIQTINFNGADVYEVEIATPLASCQLAGNLTIRQNLKISSGNFNASAFNIVLNGNWINTGSFTPGTGTVKFNGSNQTISNTLGEHFYNLTLQNSTQLVINNNVQVTNILTLTSGTISTGVNILTLGTGIPSPGSLSWVSGYIIGRLERWVAANGTYLFPVGAGGTMEALSLTVNSGLTPGSVLTYFVSGNPGNAGLPVAESGINVQNQFTEGCWNLKAVNGLAINDYDISLAANGFISYTINSDTRILKRTNGGAWILDGAHVDASNPNCFRNGLTGGISVLGTQFTLGVGDCTGGQIAGNQSICTGITPAPFTSIVAAKVGSTYTWQYTTNSAAVPGDASWTNIPSSDTPGLTYSTALTQSTWFARKASTTCGIRYSNVIEMTVSAAPVTGILYHIPNDFGY